MTSGLQEELNRRVIAAMERQRDYAVDGLRHSIDESSLKEAFAPAFFLIYVDANEELRWKRKSRARFRTIDEFLSADTHPVELPLRALRAAAFAVIENTESILEYYCALDRALRRIQIASRGGSE
jgi:dephospho-CoA kinase